MKYVRPYTLHNLLEKKGTELLRNDAIGIQLLGLNVLPDYFSISISNHYLDGAVHYGIVERKRRNISKLTNALQTLIPKYNVEAAVLGWPDAKNMENLEDVKMKIAAYEQLCNTGKFEGLKFTYWDSRSVDPKFMDYFLKDPDLPDDHPDNTREDFHDRFSSVYLLRPGMVTTDLLMSGAITKQAKFFINVLAEPAEVVVHRLQSILFPESDPSLPMDQQSRLNYIRFLTGIKAYSQIFSRLAFGARRNKYVLED